MHQGNGLKIMYLKYIIERERIKILFSYLHVNDRFPGKVACTCPLLG